MASLTIKNIPDRLVRRLKRQAALHRRSLNLEVIACLERTSGAAAVDAQALLANARSVRPRLRRLGVTDTILTRLKTSGRP